MFLMVKTGKTDSIKWSENHPLFSVCSDPESVWSERHSDGSGLQDEWPGGSEADGGVELLLPDSTAAERGRSRKGHGGEGPGLWSQLSRGGRGHRRYELSASSSGSIRPHWKASFQHENSDFKTAAMSLYLIRLRFDCIRINPWRWIISFSKGSQNKRSQEQTQNKTIEGARRLTHNTTQRREEKNLKLRRARASGLATRMIKLQSRWWHYWRRERINKMKQIHYMNLWLME